MARHLRVLVVGSSAGGGDWPPLVAAALALAEAGHEIIYFGEGGADMVNPFYVYAREGEPCPRCGAAIERLKQSGRSTFFCSGCQKSIRKRRAKNPRD